MSTNTGIEWTDATWNPIRGCSRVSEGCRNCYAEKVAYRFSGSGMPYEGLVDISIAKADYNTETNVLKRKYRGRWNGKIKFVEEHLLDPLRWKKPKRIFVNSMSDLFHENVTDEMLDKIFAVMALCPQHTFQVLTKRPERMLAYCKTLGRHHETDRVSLAMKQIDSERGAFYSLKDGGWCFPNIHLGVSVENQKAADERIPLLLQTPAAKRFISAEPLLGGLEIQPYVDGDYVSGHSVGRPLIESAVRAQRAARIKWLAQGFPLLDWVIVGGESGRKARPMHPDWARSLRDQCVAAGVPFFFKQWGEWKPISEMPESEYDALYVSNKKSPEEWQQGDFDETYGRRCKVPKEFMNYAGETGIERGFQSIDGHGGMSFYRVGKKAAGALLDGREWREMPA